MTSIKLSLYPPVFRDRPFCSSPLWSLLALHPVIEFLGGDADGVLGLHKLARERHAGGLAQVGAQRVEELQGHVAVPGGRRGRADTAGWV